MLADKYFPSKQEMTDFAKSFRALDTVNWYIRTTFECGHEFEHRKQGILLIRNERCIQRLMICARCVKRMENETEFITPTQEGGNDGSY